MQFSAVQVSAVAVATVQVLLVNGTPITLEGEEGRAIKDCLLKGAIPNQAKHHLDSSILALIQRLSIACYKTSLYAGPHQPPTHEGRAAAQTCQGHLTSCTLALEHLTTSSNALEQPCTHLFR